MKGFVTMNTQTKTIHKKSLPPHKRLPAGEIKLTATARTLYNRIYTFGLSGCWMSNDTLANQLDCCRRQIQRARQLLVRRQDIITARTSPRTWSMWPANHPAVKNAQVLYFKGGQIDNPFFVIPATSDSGVTKVLESLRSGVTFCHLWGDKMSPNLEEYRLPNGRYSTKGSKTRSRPAADDSSTQGVNPLETPRAVQVGIRVPDKNRQEFERVYANYLATKSSR